MLYWEVVDPVWDDVDIYNGGDEFLATFKPVHKSQGLLLAAHWCQSEVCNGGFHQFFLNPTGVLAPEAILGFKLIEMRGAATLALKATSMFGPRYPRDEDARTPMLDRLTAAVKSRTHWSPFEAIDDAFFELPEIKRFGEYADAFVRKNLSLFFR